MVIDKTQYIKLYSITMEEVRHHHRLYTEIWIAGIFIGGVFFAALHFLSEVPSLHTTPFMWITILLGSVVIGAFYWVAMRRGLVAAKCREIAKELEDVLAGKTPEEAIKLDDLLLTQKIEALLKQWRHVSWLVFVRCPWVIFFFAFLALWVFLCLTLLKVGVSP